MAGKIPEATKVAMQADPTDHRHGTTNGYSNLRCRCQRCRDAHAARIQQARASREALPIPEHVHGSENGYTNYRCRCERCTGAYSAANAQRARRARRARRRREKTS